jgi:hypothetical protein
MGGRVEARHPQREIDGIEVIKDVASKKNAGQPYRGNPKRREKRGVISH